MFICRNLKKFRIFFSFSLSVQDLRWNNVGIIGGRAIHAAMEVNKTLSKLELTGNNVPADIVKAIGESWSRSYQLSSDFGRKKSETKNFLKLSSNLQSNLFF